ncbi:YqzL family protein [Mechercharimyces sp. CAU 1602]|nr:YqzL family protein [Mechercharimyces sp. CAU 1602]MCS1350477.1 YqzL family protein [Mechercharimyces sp. CAU 1602]
MRNFSWSVFAVTGSVDAYLLYRDADALRQEDEADEDEPERDEGENQG